MIQEVIIEKESLEYYEYLSQKYKEIVSFLGKTDGAVDLVKVQLYFDRAVVPFSSWKAHQYLETYSSRKDDSEKKEPAEVLSPEGRKNLLKALSKKYGLQAGEGKYVLRAILQDDKLVELKMRMAQAGYKYDANSKSFVEVKE